MKKTKKKDSQAKEIFNIARTFEEASKITTSLVVMPVLLLFIGLFIDKRMGTTPLFIITGVISGIMLGLFKAISLGKNLKLNNNG